MDRRTFLGAIVAAFLTPFPKPKQQHAEIKAAVESEVKWTMLVYSSPIFYFPKAPVHFVDLKELP